MIYFEVRECSWKSKNMANLQLKNKDKRQKSANKKTQNFVKKKPSHENIKKLPGVQNFWSLEPKRKLEAKKKDNEDVEPLEKKQKLTGTERFKQFVEEEKRIRKIEEELADPDNEPHTPDQFERLLMRDANNSFLWIKYMAFHLETADTEKARAIGKRGISQINFREGGELLNVWVALLNLEIRYGTDETYQEALEESLQRNEPFKIYTKVLTILLEVEKQEEVNKIIGILLRKFKPFVEMWLTVCEAYLKMKQFQMTKPLLPKSLLSLKEKDHVDYMIKFALLHNKYEQTEFAQIIFEKILTTYNKKLPIWFTYIDMLTKNNEIEIARQTYERVLANKFPLKKLKTIFQKYMEFEKKYGDKAKVSRVKKLASSMTNESS